MAATTFVLLDSRMEFSHSDMEMIFHRVHRYYPKLMRPIALRLREAMIGLYKKAKGEMTYNATYEHNGKRFTVKEQIFTQHKSPDIAEHCNFSISMDAPEEDLRHRYEEMQEGLKIVPISQTQATRVEFRKRLVEFEKFVRSNNNKRVVFGEVKLHDICVLVGDLLGRFEEDLFILDESLNIEDRFLSVTLAGHQNKSHVITITATDAK